MTVRRTRTLSLPRDRSPLRSTCGGGRGRRRASPEDHVLTRFVFKSLIYFRVSVPMVFLSLQIQVVLSIELLLKKLSQFEVRIAIIPSIS